MKDGDGDTRIKLPLIKQSPLRPCYLDVCEAPGSCSRVSQDGFNHRDDGQDFPRVHSALRDLAPKPSTNQGRRGVFRTRNLIADSPLDLPDPRVARLKSAVSSIFFPNEFPEEAGWIREEKERDEEISSSREKTDREQSQ